MKSVAIDYIKGADKHKYVFSATSALDEMTIDLAAGRKVSQTSQDFEINLSPEYVKALGYTSSKAAGRNSSIRYLKFLERTSASY